MIRRAVAGLLALVSLSVPAVAQVQPTTPVPSKSYVDTQLGTKLPRSGGALTGGLSCAAGSTCDVSGLSAVPPGGSASAALQMSIIAARAAALGMARADVASTFIPPSLKSIRIGGYATAGDGCQAEMVRGSSTGPAAIQDALGQWWQLDLSGGTANLRCFGAKGDDTADDTTATRAWMAAAATQIGLKLYAPSGTYKLTGRVDATFQVNVQGERWTIRDFVVTGGTRFHIAHTDEGFRVRPATGTYMDWSAFRDILTYRDQPTPAAGWAPCACNYDFRIEGRTTFDNVMLLNATKGIWVRGGGALKTFNLFGQPQLVGVYYERSGDTNSHIRDTWGAYWSLDPNVIASQIANLDTYLIDSVDDLILIQPGNIYCRTLINASDSAAATRPITLTAIRPYADSCGSMLKLASNNYTLNSVILRDIFHLSDANRREADNAHTIDISGTKAANVTVSGRITRSAASALRVDGPHVVTTDITQSLANSIHKPIFVGSISGTTLTVTSVITTPTGDATQTAVATGAFYPYQRLIAVADSTINASPTTIATGTYIVQQLTGTTGGAGTYQVSVSQTVPSQRMEAQWPHFVVTGGATVNERAKTAFQGSPIQRIVAGTGSTITQPVTTSLTNTAN